jgi:hypothetical protein
MEIIAFVIHKKNNITIIQMFVNVKIFSLLFKIIHMLAAPKIQVKMETIVYVIHKINNTTQIKYL